MPDISLLNLGKPVNTLVEKISNALGRHFDPSQTIRMAEAGAKADQILRVAQAETDIEVASIRQRAGMRLAHEEVAKQANIESITGKAASYLNDDASPESMEDDWIANFFDKCRIVSDEDMQSLWGRILAGEANNPGGFSRRTVNLVADLDKRDASLFVSLCGFVWTVTGTPRSLIFDTQHDIYNRQGINFNTVGHLESLGLIHFNALSGFAIVSQVKQLTFSYFGKHVLLTLPDQEGNQFSQGQVILTQAGQQLYQVCGSAPVAGFFEYVYDRWATEGFVPSRSL